MRTAFARPILLSTALATLAIRSPGLDAQQRTILNVSVRASHDSSAVAGAHVFVQSATSISGITNESGVLRLYGAQAGAATMEVVMIGFETWKRIVTVMDGGVTSLHVELVVDPVRLTEMRVNATDPHLEKRGFYERQRHNSAGTFLTAAQLEQMQPRVLTDVLRRYGVQVGRESRGTTPTRMRGQQRAVGSCPIQYYVDGVPTGFYNADEMRPADVSGLEIYRGAASIPAVFNRGTAVCGVIVIWTKVH
jgi:hypothetical protein